MGIIAWLVLGLLSGFIASMLVNKSGEGLIGDIVLGIIGAFVGGYITSLATGRGITGLDLWSILVSVLGAVVVLFIYHAITGRRKVT